ncbi:hypothetical protein MMIC_P0978 [Mariprofundus micogutta]|uniref:Uncharacterized protein n=1 Tax=Mariprofundus micogutta TaxID=1921010 RepID=A0A1L8CM80_9PROT|nr:hypothetical protein [Mariprofundus micogutta]GAV20017.1 hypothetical protein MMIC_P0978 [Mariprofundus micogutta]
MAISIQPVDGLINRLLHQNGKSPSISNSNAPLAKPANDHVNISPKAQEHQSLLASDSQSHPQQKPGEKALESHLLNLYRSNDRFGG